MRQVSTDMSLNIFEHPLRPGYRKIHVCIAYKTYAAEKLTDLLHLQLITCTMQVSEFENKNSYLGVVKFKTEDQKFLGRLLIFTPIPLNAQNVWSLNQFQRRE